MITAVFDANVIVAAFANPVGTPAELLKHWRLQQFKLAVSETILSEVEGAWAKPYWANRFSPEDVFETNLLLREFSDVIPISITLEGVATHPEDDLVLATAGSANADFLVTGDKQLLAIGYFEGTRIVSPREF
jgi:uncharacterized protein